MRLKKDKSGDTVGRPSWRSPLPGDPGAEFFCEKPQNMKNSLNFANTCLKVVDTRRSDIKREKNLFWENLETKSGYWKTQKQRNRFGIWSGRWESNPRPKLGKLLYCHCTTPAHSSSLLIIHN